MSDLRAQQDAFTACRDGLLTGIVRCKELAKQGEEEEKRWHEYSNALARLKREHNDLREAINYCTKLYKNINAYLVHRKEYAEELLKSAVEQAALMVPDANIAGSTLLIKDKTAKVVNSKGQDLNLREGSAYRTIMGILMDTAAIRTQPDAIQAVFLDETFSTLSDSTAALMREMLDELRKEMLIVGIEQRNILYDGIDRDVYEIHKSEEGVTTARKIVSATNEGLKE